MNPTPPKGLIAWFATNPVAANLLMLLVIMAGVLTMDGLRKEAFPSRQPDSITVSVSYKTGSAQQSEEALAIKIEESLESVVGIKQITSQSTPSGTTVTIEKGSAYDLDTLLRDVKTQVDAISNWPVEADQPVIKQGRREDHAITVQLYGDVDRHTLQQLADTLKDDLLAQPDIHQVTINGWLDPMMAIEIDEARLQAFGLTFNDVQTAVNRYSSDNATAVLRQQNAYLQIKADRQAYYRQQFADIPLISGTRGEEVKLGDIATIRDTFQDDTPMLSRFNGHDSIALDVVSTDEDDIARSVQATQRVMQQWQHNQRLPDSVQMISWNDRSQSIQQRLDLLIKNAATGVILVFCLLAVFLNLRVAFWVAMGLPFIFFGTLFIMGLDAINLTLNSFTTFGFIMALGIVVDDAVVVGESVYATRARYGDTLNNTVLGTHKVAIPTLFGVLTTVAAFTALAQVQGGLGHLYAQFASVVAICLLLSVIESKLILPAHLVHLPTHRNQARRHGLARLWQRIQNGADRGLDGFRTRLYQPLLKQALQHRYAVVVLSLALLLGVGLMPFNGAVRMSFFPDIPGDTVRVSLTMRNDASYGQTHRALAQLAQQAQQLDQQLRHGQGDTAIDHLQVVSSSDHSGSLTVELKADAPFNNRLFAARWRAIAGQPEGVRTLSIQSRRGGVDALRIELRARDDEVLNAAGEALKTALNQNAAISGVSDNLTPGQPQLYLALTSQGRALGMTTEQLAQQLYQAFSGQITQRYQRGSDEIEVKVRYPESDRQSAAQVLAARIRTPEGQVIPVASVARAEFGFTRDSITRIDGQRAVYIAADVDKDQMSTTDLVAQLRAGIATELKRQYPTLDLHFAGEAEEQAETSHSMAHMFWLALLVIYLLLAIPLKSYAQPVLIMTAIPFGIVGAILGHWLNDLALGILSFNGIIALSGVVVNDSLLLVSRYNELRRIDQMSMLEAAMEAGSSRLRAVLLTSVTTYAGLMPLLSETSRQAQFLIPAAVSLGYGILFATVITLILIPVLIVIQSEIADRWHTLWSSPREIQPLDAHETRPSETTTDQSRSSL